MNLYEVINTDNIKDGVYRLFFDIEADSKAFMDEYDTDDKKEEIITHFICLVNDFIDVFRPKGSKFYECDPTILKSEN